MPDDANDLIGMIQNIKDALDIVRSKHRDLGMTLVRADLELLVEAKTSASAGGVTPMLPIDIGFKGDWSNVQTFGLTITPSGSVGDLGALDVEDELARGMLAIADTLKKIHDLHKGTWLASNPKLTVNVGRERTGSLKIGAGGGKSSRRSHTITLTFLST